MATEKLESREETREHVIGKLRVILKESCEVEWPDHPLDKVHLSSKTFLGGLDCWDEQPKELGDDEISLELYAFDVEDLIEDVHSEFGIDVGRNYNVFQTLEDLVKHIVSELLSKSPNAS